MASCEKDRIDIQTCEIQSIEGYYHIPKNPIVCYTNLNGDKELQYPASFIFSKMGRENFKL